MKQKNKQNQNEQNPQKVQNNQSQNQLESINISNQFILLPEGLETRSAIHTYMMQNYLYKQNPQKPNKLNLNQSKGNKSNSNQNKQSYLDFNQNEEEEKEDQKIENENKLFELKVDYNPEANKSTATVVLNQTNHLNEKELKEAKNESNYFKSLIDSYDRIKNYLNSLLIEGEEIKEFDFLSSEELEHYFAILMDLCEALSAKGPSLQINKLMELISQINPIRKFLHVKERIVTDIEMDKCSEATINGEQTLKSLKKLYHALLKINFVIAKLQINDDGSNFFPIELQNHIKKQLSNEVIQVLKEIIFKILNSTTLTSSNKKPIENEDDILAINELNIFKILHDLKEKETKLETVGIDLRDDCKKVIVKMKELIGNFDVTKDTKNTENNKIQNNITDYFKTIPNEILQQTSLYLTIYNYLITDISNNANEINKVDKSYIQYPTFSYLINSYLINNTKSNLNTSSTYNGLTDKEKKEVQMKKIQSKTLDSILKTNNEEIKKWGIMIRNLVPQEIIDDKSKMKQLELLIFTLLFIQTSVEKAESTLDLQIYSKLMEIDFTTSFVNINKINEFIRAINKLEDTKNLTRAAFEKRNFLLQQLIINGKDEMKLIIKSLYSFINHDDIFTNAATAIFNDSPHSMNPIAFFENINIPQNEIGDRFILGHLQKDETSNYLIKSSLLPSENEEITAQNLGTEELNNNLHKNRKKRKRKQNNAKKKAAELEQMELQEEALEIKQEEQEIKPKKAIQVKNKEPKQINLRSIDDNSLDHFEDEIIEFQIEDEASSIVGDNEKKIRVAFEKSKIDFKFGEKLMLEERMKNWTLLENWLTTTLKQSTINNKLIEDAATFLGSLNKTKLEIFYFPCTDFNKVVDLSLLRVSFKKAKLNIAEQIYYFKHIYEVATSSKPDQKTIDINGISLTHQTRSGFPTNCSIWYKREGQKIIVYALGRHLNNTYHFDLHCDEMPDKYKIKK